MYYFPLIFRLLPKYGSMCVCWYVFWLLWSNHSRYGIQILGKVSLYEFLASVIIIFFEKNIFLKISPSLYFTSVCKSTEKAISREIYTFFSQKWFDHNPRKHGSVLCYSWYCPNSTLWALMAGTLRQVSYFSVLPRSGGGTVPFLPIHTSHSIVTLANHYTVSLKRLALWYSGDVQWWKV